MAGRRAERVGRQVVQALAEVVETGVHDPRLAGLTFTSASASDDLRNVRVLYTVLVGQAGQAGQADQSGAREDARRGLESATGYLRRELAHRLSLRYVPALSFEFDASADRADRIDELLRGGKAS